MKVYCVFESSNTCLADRLIEIFYKKDDAEFYANQNKHRDYYVEEKGLIEGKLS